jgi:hypothetical protein
LERLKPLADAAAVAQSAAMLRRAAALLIAFCAACPAGALAQPAGGTAGLRLQAIGADEAAALIGILRDLQRRLSAGETLTFELLSGAPASYAMTETSPRTAFLGLPLDRVFSVERVRTDSPLWQPHRLVIAPDGPGRLIWDVEVVLGVTGNVERVQMIYRPPPPF